MSSVVGGSKTSKLTEIKRVTYTWITEGGADNVPNVIVKRRQLLQIVTALFCYTLSKKPYYLLKDWAQIKEFQEKPMFSL